MRRSSSGRRGRSGCARGLCGGGPGRRRGRGGAGRASGGWGRGWAEARHWKHLHPDFRLSTRKLACRPCGRRPSPHPCYLFCGHRIPVIYSANHPLLISLFVLDFARIPARIGGLVLLFPKTAGSSKPQGQHKSRRNQNTGKLDNAAQSQQPATFDHSQARSCRPLSAAMHLLLCLPLVCPAHLLAASGGPHPVGLS